MRPRSILRSVSGFIPSISRLTTNLIYDRWHVDYEDLKGKPFFPGLIKYMAAGPVVGMVWEGLDAQDRACDVGSDKPPCLPARYVQPISWCSWK